MTKTEHLQPECGRQPLACQNIGELLNYQS